MLLLGILAGSLIGIFARDAVDWLKPIGDVFLNLLFTAVVPLLFFTITSAVSSIQESHQLGKIIGYMAGSFLFTILTAAIFMLFVFWVFPLNFSINSVPVENFNVPSSESMGNWQDEVVEFLTVGEFNLLLSRQHMLAFILFSILVGIAALRSGEKGAAFKAFLHSGNQVMTELLNLIMRFAPVGLGAYFAYQVGTIGPELFGVYGIPLAYFYLGGLVYFALFFTLYAFLAYRQEGVRRFWRYNILPSLTAISTCSSFACIPVNLEAAKKIGVSESVRNMVIPLGASFHKDGSSLSSIVKISTAFAILGRDLFDPWTLLSALGITVLVSLVAGGIPSGGFIGELLMISIYNLPVEAIPAVMIIGALVDPLATVLNSTGDTVASMLTNRLLGKKLEVDTFDSQG